MSDPTREDGGDILAVDGGQTGTRARRIDRDGHRSPVRRGPGLPPAGRADGPDGIADAVAQAAGDGQVSAVAAGLSGIAEAPERATLVAAALSERLDGARVLLVSDVVTSHAGALGGGPGVVVAAGTGAVAFALAPSGASARADGWGYLVGDEGSGFAVGRAGLDAALRAYDGRAGGSERLLMLAAERYGPLASIGSALMTSDAPAREVAAFARDVATAADHCSVARRIWSASGDALAETAAAAARRAGLAPEAVPDPTTGLRSDPATGLRSELATKSGAPGAGAGGPAVSWAGALFDAGALLRVPFRAGIGERLPSAAVVAPRGDALEGAALLATRPELPHHAARLH